MLLIGNIMNKNIIAFNSWYLKNIPKDIPLSKSSLYAAWNASKFHIENNKKTQ